MPEKEEVKEEKETYSVQPVATETKQMVTVGDKALTTEEALVLVLNKLDKMEKKIVG